MARRVRPGDVAGTVNSNGYVILKIGNRTWRAHRVAWLFVYGEWPKQQIDHINGDRSDNRIANLRDVEPRINSQNRLHSNSNNSNGLLGASKKRGRFQSSIRINGKQTYLGTFDTPELANAAYLEAKARFHDFQ